MRFDLSKLEMAMAREFATSKKTWTTYFRDSMKSFMRKVALLTPPGKATNAELEGRIPKGAFTQAKKAGEAAIDIDLARLFVSSLESIPEINRTQARQDRRVNSQPSQMKAALKKARNRYGRVKKNVVPIFVFAKGINALSRTQKRKVGFLAAGWKTGASGAGAKLIAWMDRHNNPGALKYEVNSQSGACLFEARNNTTFVNQMKAMQFYMRSAAGWEARNIMKQVAKYEGKRRTIK